jgi:hypothetical protein
MTGRLGTMTILMAQTPQLLGMKGKSEPKWTARLLFRSLAQLSEVFPNKTKSLLYDLFVPITLEVEHKSHSPSSSVSLSVARSKNVSLHSILK